MKITNNLNLPKPFVSAVESDYEYKEKRYSVTQILKGYKEIMLERRHADEIEQDVSEMIWLIFGKMVHLLLENSEEEMDELKETKLELEVLPGYTLSGIQDLYSESLKRITDYKVTSVYKVKNRDYEDYRKQLLSYAYMFRYYGFPVDNAENILVLRDWSVGQSKREAGYPDNQVVRVHFDFKEQDFEWIWNYITDRFEHIRIYEKMADDEIPECTPEERWNVPPKFAVMKKGNKKAVKLFDKEMEALDFAIEKGSANHYVEERPGANRKCEEYCRVCKFCSYYKEKYGEEPEHSTE